MSRHLAGASGQNEPAKAPASVMIKGGKPRRSAFWRYRADATRGLIADAVAYLRRMPTSMLNIILPAVRIVFRSFQGLLVIVSHFRAMA